MEELKEINQKLIDGRNLEKFIVLARQNGLLQLDCTPHPNAIAKNNLSCHRDHIHYCPSSHWNELVHCCNQYFLSGTSPFSRNLDVHCITAYNAYAAYPVRSQKIKEVTS